MNSLLLLLLTLALTSSRPWARGDGGAGGGAEVAVTLLVVFVSFASTVVAQHDAHPMLGRLLRHAKALAGLSSLCALGAAALVALTEGLEDWLWLATAVSVLCALLLTGAAFQSRSRGQRREHASPWDFTPGGAPSTARAGTSADRWCPGPADEKPPDDATARRRLGLDLPAIDVATAEGVRHRTRWSQKVDEELSRRLVAALEALDGANEGLPGRRYTRPQAP